MYISYSKIGTKDHINKNSFRHACTSSPLPPTDKCVRHCAKLSVVFLGKTDIDADIQSYVKENSRQVFFTIEHHWQ